MRLPAISRVVRMTCGTRKWTVVQSFRYALLSA